MACFNIPGDAALSPDGRTLLRATDGQALAQRLRAGIHTIRGTYKYDLSRGIPWFQLLDKPNQALLRSAMRDYFLSYPEVHSILSLEFQADRQTRLLSVIYQLRMADGQVVAGATAITPLA